ncbi:DNA-binding transcriptional repressor MarR [Thalassoglobus neptunius]|uniref:DNA-binding transcriptional repressor MarR n=1 Tax=Thalassoglobus neptunius TaxID=1938619 RepID=A0A5C5X5V3_9PLAN|nr:MarR family winged helix-turn-helix transcriptional regulator [Thalassoglobus neptunius]TWT58148.1 DNA-binding transcriptional repressor MarR [Thalassoglobus neptunius]
MIVKTAEPVQLETINPVLMAAQSQKLERNFTGPTSIEEVRDSDTRKTVKIGILARFTDPANHSNPNYPLWKNRDCGTRRTRMNFTQQDEQQRIEIGTVLRFVEHFKHSLSHNYQTRLNITVNAAAVLREIGDRQSVNWTQSELAGDLCLSESTLCTLIERLRREGLVKRSRLEIDRRKTQLNLTPSGCDLVRQIHEVDDEILVRWQQVLSDSELTQLNSTFARITQTIQHQDQAADAARRAA